MAKLYIICGAAGVGKTTYGKKWSAEIGACFLDSDTVTEAVVQAGMKAARLDSDDRDSPEYQALFREAVYESLYAVAQENLMIGPVVMVGPFTREIQRMDWKVELQKRLLAEVEVIFLTCKEVVRKERIEKRGNPRDAWKIEHWGEYLSKSVTAAPVFKHTLVST